MASLIIHIGAPRTGTTVIQKHALKLLKKNLCISKEPYTGGVKTDLRHNSNYNLDQLISLNNLPPLRKGSSNSEALAILTSLVQATALASVNDRNYHKKLSLKLQSTIQSYINHSKDSNIVISLERLCDTAASLMGDSSHERKEREFNAITLLKAIKKTSADPLISTFLRDPIPYLRSRYLRNLPMRKQAKLRQLTSNEYIQKQTVLETNHPGSSALTPAMHAEFIKQLQKHAFVKASGFQELLASDDVFSLMGIQGEDRYAFRDFPRENKLNFTKEQEQAIEIEITQALKQYGFYDRIMKAQMFE